MAQGGEFDVCVIGTGAGGGVMILELTAAGFHVVALERGPKLELQQFMSDDELSFVIRDEVFSSHGVFGQTNSRCSPPMAPFQRQAWSIGR